jgi:flavodoxin
MRVAVVYFPVHKHSRIGEMAKAVAAGIASQGHEIEIIDGFSQQNKKLIMYQYIAIGTEQTSLFGKIDQKITHFLASQGTVQGKKGFAFVTKKTMGSPRALLRLMAAMEKEGIVVRTSEILSHRKQATDLGSQLRIDK